MEKKEEEDKQDAPEESKPQGSLDIKLKKGDYRVHVFLEQVRSLCPSEGSDTSDPVFIISAFNTSKSTKSFEKVGSESIVSINEHIFIDGFHKIPEEINNERISIQVRDHSSMLTDIMLGGYEMDMTYLYSLPDHSLVHQWIILSNPDSETFSDLKGYLKIGISVMHEDDKAIDLCQPEKSEKHDSTLLPVHVKPKTMQMIVQVIKAENLPVMDRGGTLDAYCTVKFSGAEGKTSVITADKATMSAMWCEEVYLPCMVPCVSSSIKVTLMDHDTIGQDELVGSVFLNFDQMKAGRYKEFFWCNFYGAPPLASGEHAEIMNNVPQKASHWRGRLLLKAWTEEKVKTVFKKTEKIKEENFEATIIEEFETGETYEIRAQVLSASALPEKSGKYKVKVEWSGLQLASTEKATENGCIDWFEVCKRQVTQIPKHCEKLLPDAIVYLMRGDNKLCYLRIPAAECLSKNSPAVWRKLKPEPNTGTVKEDWKAGYLRVKLYIGELIEGADDGNWPNLKMPPVQKFKLYVHVFQCRDLAAADKNGLADPYLNIYCAGMEASTKSNPCELTLNPRWYQTFLIPISIISIEEAAPLIISIFDHDDIDSDDFLGMCLVELIQAAVNPEAAPEPKWTKLSMGEDGLEKGEILVSFSFSSKLNEDKVFNIMPIFTDKTIDINILGLRDLKPSVGWLPVNKAFLKFDLNSLEVPGASQTVKPLETQPFEGGSDPNILTTLSARLKMPVVRLYASSLTVTVHDYLFQGVSQPLIGTFSIDLANYYSTKKAKDRDLFAQSTRIKMPVIEKKQPRTQTLEEVKVDIDPQDELDFKDVCENEKLMIIIPTFELKGKKLREVNHADPTKYAAVGYNRIPDDGKKYYRYLLNDIFEKTHIFSNLPFEEFAVTRGQLVGSDEHSFLSIFSKKSETSEEPSTLQNVGTFKALIKIRDYPQIVKDEEFENITKKLLNKKKCIVRVYILDAFELEQKDSNSLSDPYVRIKLADTVITDRDNHQEDMTNPKVYKCFDLHTSLPGKSILKVQMWDYNEFAADSKIGTTRIDLEDRFFNDAWLGLKQKPAETRPLLVRTCKRAQGYIRLWVEIYEEGPSAPPTEDISVKPPEEFEARLIIWKSEDVPNNDIEGLSDLYIVAKVNNLPSKQTDTHFRAARGKGSWNWRLLFDLTLPNASDNILTLQIWDKDILTGDDLISECSVMFNEIAKQAWEESCAVQMLKAAEGLAGIISRKESNVFWVQCNAPGGVEAGKLQISFELIPKSIAINNKVGEARDEPNHSPVLAPPVGRFKFSLNPLDMLGQLVGPELKRKVCCILCLALCFLLIIFALPIFLTNGVSYAVFGG